MYGGPETNDLLGSKKFGPTEKQSRLSVKTAAEIGLMRLQARGKKKSEQRDMKLYRVISISFWRFVNVKLKNLDFFFFLL